MSNNKSGNTKGAAAPETKGAVVAAAKGAVAIPDWMKDKAGKGTENLTSADVEMPRLKLLQGISEELTIFDGVKSGEFFHTLAERSLGTKIEFIPIYQEKCYVLWRPRAPIDQGGILARADDGIHWNQGADQSFNVKIDKKGTTVTWKTGKTVEGSGLANWGTYDPTDPNSQPAATLCYKMAIVLPEFPELGPMAMLLQRSAVKPTKKLLGKFKMSGAPIYGHRILMESFVDSGSGGDFNNYRFTSNGFVADKDECDRYEVMHEQFVKTGVKTKLEDTDDAPGGKADEAAEAAATKKNF